MAEGEIRAFSADQVFSLGTPSSPQARTCSRDEGILENDQFFVKLDPVSGGLLSLKEKTTGWELLSGGQFPSGVPLWETPMGGDRREIHPTPDWTKFMGYKGWNTTWEARRESPTPEPFATLHTAKGRRSLHQTFTSPHANAITVRVMLDEAVDAVGLEVSIDFRRNLTPSAWYFPLSFAMNDPQFTYDNCGVSVQLGLDQLPGANMDYQTVHRWIRAADDAHSALIFPLDTPIVCLGGMTFGRMTTMETPRSGLVAPILQTNYWDTNYSASCEGLVTFRFFVTPGNLVKTCAEANALSSRLAHPPLAVPFAGPAARA
jgi:hypothetical protein